MSGPLLMYARGDPYGSYARAGILTAAMRAVAALRPRWEPWQPYGAHEPTAPSTSTHQRDARTS